MDGMLVSVGIVPAGSSATQDQAVGDSTVVVDDVTDFAPDVDLADANDVASGTLDICDVRYDYEGVDPETGTITLSSPLTAAVDEGDPVLSVAGGQVSQAWIATVDLGEGDNVEVPLSFSFRALLPVGFYDPPVPVRLSDDLTELVDAPGRQPVIAPEVHEASEPSGELTWTHDGKTTTPASPPYKTWRKCTITGLRAQAASGSTTISLLIDGEVAATVDTGAANRGLAIDVAAGSTITVAALDDGATDCVTQARVGGA